MAWVQWDNGFKGNARLDPALAERGNEYLKLLGYRELVVREPEAFIPRFGRLLGSAEFELLDDGRVLQTYPSADFSVEAVRGELSRMAREAANRELTKTDWYVMRKVETGAEIPEKILSLRNSIRDHIDWIDDDLAKRAPRELVDYEWMFPQTADQVMLNGTPVILSITPPALVQPIPLLPEEYATGAGFDPDAEVLGNADPDVVDPAPEPPPEPVRPTAPPTTDGPVLVHKEKLRPALDAEGFPLVTVYAPTVEDTGPRPTE